MKHKSASSALVIFLALLLLCFGLCSLVYAGDLREAAIARLHQMQPYSGTLASEAKDYTEVYAALQKVYSAHRYVVDLKSADGAFAVEESAEAAEAPSASFNSAADAGMGAGGDDEYSGTNVQVEGIDEGDIVKTDGKYIYYLRGGELLILEADGPDTREVSKLILASEEDGTSISPQDLILSGDRLAVLGHRYSYGSFLPNDGKVRTLGYFRGDNECVLVYLYDISDPAHPKKLGEFAQDGYLNASRCMDGVLYLISNYWFWNEPLLEDAYTYVPCVYENGKAELVPAASICIPEEPENSSYVVISSVDLQDGRRVDSASLLGRSGTVYMSPNNIYLCESRYRSEQSEPYQKDQYTVVDYAERQTQEIYRYAVEDGALDLQASTALDGSLLNQFSLDEKDGYLRLVMSQNGWSYSIYTDSKYHFDNYVSNDDTPSSNGLYVLDQDLELVGKVDDLAKGERVYSVRFLGDTAYFVTFRETDPLFVADLSDPAAPKITGSVKLPGFSQYLHPFGSGLLFGFGRDADEENGWAEGLKLTMFNVADPAAPKELCSSVLEDEYYSEALYDHHAILVSAERDLIGFSAGEKFYVYSFDASKGFRLLGSFETGSWCYGDRSLYIGNYFYLCNESAVTVVDLGSFTPVSRVELPYG